MARKAPHAKRAQPVDPRVIIRRQFRAALFKSLVLPFLLLMFFIAAPSWLNWRIHQEIENRIMADDTLNPLIKQRQIAAYQPIDFQQLSLHGIPGLEAYRTHLVQVGLVRRFQRLRIALIVAWLLMAMLAIGIVAMLELARAATRSHESLIQCYRWGWRIGIILAMANVVLLVPLMIDGLFEFFLLASDSYAPQLLLALAFIGLVALWSSLKVLCARAPMEFQERMAREVTHEDAPALWQSVRDAAAQLGTSPPEHILIGMNYTFWVTELDVVFSSGRTAGKTLYLSYPLLKQLSRQEVMGVIGHELGHFIGADTEMTRHFFPMRWKVGGVIRALKRSEIATWPSLFTVCLFLWTFEGVARESSRARELLADRRGADLAGPDAQAHALVRLHVVLAAVDRGLLLPAGALAANPFDSRTANFVAANLTPEDPFWTTLFKKEQSHPMDTHPRLSDRLDALGRQYTPQDARAIACEDTPPAFDAWFPGGETLFQGILSEAQTALTALQRRQALAKATLETDEGRRLLLEAFPPVRWTGRRVHFWVSLICLLFFLVLLTMFVIFIPEVMAKLYFAIVLLILGLATIGYWQRDSRAVLTLTVDGLEYSGWHRRLLFTEIEALAARHTYGNFILILKMKQPTRSPYKFTFLARRRRAIPITLSKLKGKQLDIANTIHRYYARQLPPEPKAGGV
jgi:Zn-dependent protease with chaperone function